MATPDQVSELRASLESLEAEDPTAIEDLRRQAQIESLIDQLVPIGESSFLRSQRSLLRSVADTHGVGALQSLAARRIPLEEILRQQGIDPRGGAPASSRALASLAPEQTVDAVRRALSAHFDAPVEVQIDSRTGRMTFLDPRDGKVRLVDELGPELGDVAGMAGGAMVLAGEIAGAIAAGSVPGGAVVGGAAGATIGQQARVRLGERLGVVPSAEAEGILESATTVGVPALVGGAVGGAAAKGLQRAASREIRAAPRLGIEPSRETVEAIAGGAQEAAPLAREVAEATGREFRFTAGQVAQETVPGSPVYALERSLARTPGLGDPIREVYDAQQATFQTLFNKEAQALGLEGIEAEAFSVGRSLQNETRRRLALVEERLGRRVGEAEAAEADAIAGVRAEALAGQNIGLGEAIKGVIRREQAEFQQIASAKYAELDAVARSTAGVDSIPVGAFNQAAREARGILDENVLSVLTPVDRRVVEQAMRAGLPEDITEEALEAGATGTLTFGQIQSTLSALKTLERNIRTGATTDISLATVTRLRRGLSAARAEFLRDKPTLAAKVEEVEGFVREHKANLDRSLVGDLVRLRGGREAVASEMVFDKILRPNNATAAKQVAAVLKDPTGTPTPEDLQLYDDALQGIRRGVLDLYERRVLKRGVVDRRAHEQFWRDFGTTVEPFFTADERQRLRSLISLRDVIERQTARRDRLLDVARRNLDPIEVSEKTRAMDVFRLAWSRGDAGTVRAVRKAIGNDEMLLKMYRAAAHREILNSIRSEAGEVTRFDWRRIGKVSREQGEKIEVLFGSQYRKDLELFARATERAQKPPALEQRVRITEDETALRALLRTIFRPLSRAGLAKRAADRLRAQSAERALVQALRDPEEFAKLLKLRAEKTRSAAAAEIAAGFGTVLWMTDPGIFPQSDLHAARRLTEAAVAEPGGF